MTEELVQWFQSHHWFFLFFDHDLYYPHVSFIYDVWSLLIYQRPTHLVVVPPLVSIRINTRHLVNPDSPETHSPSLVSFSNLHRMSGQPRHLLGSTLRISIYHMLILDIPETQLSGMAFSGQHLGTSPVSFFCCCFFHQRHPYTYCCHVPTSYLVITWTLAKWTENKQHLPKRHTDYR